MDAELEPFDRSFDSLEALADTISEVMQGPVTIEDANHRLLAYSSHDPQTDPARIATIIGRRVPEKVIRSLWQAGVIQKLMMSDEPVFVSAIEDIGLGDRLAVAIRKNDDVLGYIWVLEMNKECKEEQAGYLVKAARAAKTKLLQMQMKSRKEELEYQEFFWQLLTGHLKSDALIKEKAENDKIVLPSLFHVAVCEFSSEITENMHQQIRYMIATTQRLRVVFHLINENRLILLAGKPDSSNPHTDIFLHLIEQMKNRFGFAPETAGRGSFYEDYTRVESSYQEALTVIQMKKRFPQHTKEVYDYVNLGYFRYLPMILEQKKKGHFAHEGLRRLKQYDRDNKSDLLKTLEIYLDHNGNPRGTANVLHVHTNTLNYRLKRIMEIANINLNNTNDIVTVILELKTDQLQP